MADSTKDNVEEKTTADPEVIQKYKAAGDIVNSKWKLGQNLRNNSHADIRRCQSVTKISHSRTQKSFMQ